jgi:hypothetical protein
LPLPEVALAVSILMQSNTFSSASIAATVK